MPPVGYLELEDAETGDHLVVNTSDPAFRALLEAEASQSRHDRERLFRQTKVDLIDVRTDHDYVDPLQRFFRLRAKRFR